MPMQRDLYPREWEHLALQVKIQAAWTCQQCGSRRGDGQLNRHGQMSRVELTVAHLDHDPWNPDARLVVLCRQCHLRYDARDRARRQAMMTIARGQRLLPGMDVLYPVGPSARFAMGRGSPERAGSEVRESQNQ